MRSFPNDVRIFDDFEDLERSWSSSSFLLDLYDHPLLKYTFFPRCACAEACNTCMRYYHISFEYHFRMPVKLQGRFGYALNRLLWLCCWGAFSDAFWKPKMPLILHFWMVLSLEVELVTKCIFIYQLFLSFLVRSTENCQYLIEGRISAMRATTV